jgi:hypothetical protein
VSANGRRKSGSKRKSEFSKSSRISENPFSASCFYILVAAQIFEK